MPSRSKKIAIKKHPNFFRDEETGIIHFRKRVGGKSLHFTTKTTVLKDAKKFVEKRLRVLKNSKGSKISESVANSSIERLYQKLIQHKRASGVSEQTLAKYEMNWRVVFSEYFGALHVADITQNKITQFESWYLKKYPNRNYFNTRKHLRALTKFARKQGYSIEEIEFSDLDQIINRNIKREKVGRVFTQKEMEKLMRAADKKTRFAILVYSSIGLRKRELLDLKVSDFDQKSGELKVWASKTGRHKIIPLPNSLQKEFKIFIKNEAGEEYLFESRSGGKIVPMRSQVFEKLWKSAKEKSGIKNALEPGKARLHDLRHTCATHFAQSGMPVPVACAILGMSLKVFEKTYLHVTEKSKADWMERLYEKS